jgi:hypothetical protein
MTIPDWLEAARTDADKRDLPQLKPLLETLARSTERLRQIDADERTAREGTRRS